MRYTSASLRVQLLFEPLPLLRTEDVRAGAGFIPMVAAIQENDFHSSSGRTKGVGGEHSRLFPARAFRWFIEEIEQEPLALDLVRVVLPTIALAVIMVIPRPQNAALFAERLVLGLVFLRAIASREIG